MIRHSLSRWLGRRRAAPEKRETAAAHALRGVRDPYVWSTIRRTFDEHEGVEAFFSLLGHEALPVRLYSAVLLGSTGVRGARERLVMMLHDPASDDCAVGAIGLSFLGDRRAVQHLIRSLDHEDRIFRREAATALGRMETLAALAVTPLMERWSVERDPDVSTAIIEAARRIQDAIRRAPAELVSAPVPAGRGTEPAAAPPPAGRGTEPETVAAPAGRGTEPEAAAVPAERGPEAASAGVDAPLPAAPPE